MKKLLLHIALILLSIPNLFASFSTDWIKPADSNQKQGTMIARDKSDNLIVTGYIQANNIFTRKYDKFGTLIWAKTSSSGIAGNYEKPRWVNCDQSKNVYVVGYRYSWSSSWEYPNAVIVIKYSPNGALLWKQTIGLSYIVGSSTGYAFNLESELDDNGNLFIGTAGTSPAGMILIKMNPSGTVLFNNTINFGVWFHKFSSMRIKGNKVVLTGTTVVAWDTAGNFLWDKYSGGLSGVDVEIDGNKNIYVLTSGSNQVSPTSGADIVIYKLNSAGTQLWKKKYDFGGQDVPTRFTFVSNKLSVIGYGSIAGSYFDWLTFQVNNSGTKLWDVRYNATSGNDEQPYSLTAKANGEVFVTGKGGPMFTQPNGSSYLRMVTLKYSNTGVMQWRDTANIYSGWGLASTLASDSSLFVLGGTNMTAFHFLDHTGLGSCGIPSGIAASNVIDTSALISWSAVPGAYLYHLRYKTTTATDWTVLSTNQTSKKIKTLSAGTTYYYAVEAICSSGPSGYSTSQLVTTTGAGYCVTGGLSTAQEFLNLVWIGGIQNSTLSNNGYGDFTNLSTPLTQGAIVYGYLSGALPFGLTENYSIWIDYNHNSDFSDPGELAVNISSTFLGYIAVNFTVPANALPGITRMRVTMRYGSSPAPCGLYSRGETEDYSVIITTPAKNEDPLKIENRTEHEFQSAIVYPNPFQSEINLEFDLSEVDNVSFSLFDITGREIKIFLESTFQAGKNHIKIDLNELKSGMYFLTLKSNKNIQTIKLIKTLIK